MPGTSQSDDVGSDLIDAYLIAVENALVAAGAPRADRLQVLENLETQIAEMLAPHPLPFTEETVRAVLDKLEPPSHFAATYGNGREAPASPSTQTRFAPRSYARWALIAAVSCALFSFGCVLVVLAAGMHARGVLDISMFLVLVGLVVTPIALFKAYKQLRAEPGRLGRDLVLSSTVSYGVVASVLLLLFAMEISDGAALIPLGIGAFFYFQYMLIRRLWRYMSEVLPPQRTAPTSHSNGHDASSSVASAMSMPAM